MLSENHFEAKGLLARDKQSPTTPLPMFLTTISYRDTISHIPIYSPESDKAATNRYLTVVLIQSFVVERCWFHRNSWADIQLPGDNWRLERHFSLLG